MKEENKITPMMAQWHECKKKAKDALLFFHLGDFYEAFYEDAKIISKELHLTLTKRQEIPMCGVPLHTSEVYVDKLLQKGFKVAIADQIGDPNKAKGLMKREIVRILTPATSLSSLIENSSNYFVSIAKIAQIFGIAKIDLSTSSFTLMELEEDLFDELYRIKPKEILVSKTFFEKNSSFFLKLKESFSPLINVKEDYYFDPENSIETLKSHLKVFSLDALGLKGMLPAIIAASALIKYFQEDLLLSLSEIKTLQVESLKETLFIDYTSMKNLEILEATSNHSLFNLLDHTKTAMGKRLLKDFLSHPLLSLEKIKERQDAIEECLNKETIAISLIENLEKIKDLERLISKVAQNLAGPRDLVLLKSSLFPLSKIQEILENFSSPLFEKNHFKNLKDLACLLEKALIEQTPLRLSDGNVFKEGFDPRLDELFLLLKESKSWILNYQAKLKEETSIKTLKIGFTNVFGYFIEVSKGQVDKIPPYFERRQTLVNGERFTTKELREFEEKILTAEEKISLLSQELFSFLKEEILKQESAIKKDAKILATLDVILSLAFISKKYHYIRPVLDHSDKLIIKDGRHPILESILPFNKFIPNDIYLDSQNTFLLLTGPNMAGKSTYLRQIALLTILAQIGSFIPASYAHIGVIEKIFTRIGAADDLTRGQSTFMVEMCETANILHHANSKSLVILDEIGRGTSTYDGISIAFAVAEYLLLEPSKCAKTLFATHYFELTELSLNHSKVKNFTTAVEETQDSIVFLRKIIPGSADKSYGIHVAKLANLPSFVIEKAKKILKKLEKKEPLQAKTQKVEEQLTIFSLPKKNLLEIEKEIKDLKIEEISPLEALKKLFAFKEKLSKEG